MTSRSGLSGPCGVSTRAVVRSSRIGEYTRTVRLPDDVRQLLKRTAKARDRPEWCCYHLSSCVKPAVMRGAANAAAPTNMSAGVWSNPSSETHRARAARLYGSAIRDNARTRLLKAKTTGTYSRTMNEVN